MGPPARGGRGGGGGEGLPQSSRGPCAAPFTEDSGHQGLKRTSRVPAPRGPSAQGPPGGAVLGPGPSQHQWLQGRVRLRLTPAPTLQAAGAQATRVHTLGHVTDCVHQGSRSPLTEASRAGGRGLWPSTYGSPHRAWAWAPPAAGVCWGSFLYTQGAHESLVQTAQWAPGPATELRRPTKETLSVPDNSQREALSKRAALKCVQ